MTEKERIIYVSIEEEMKSSYIDYAMSVIVSRALPDVRDGLKPVQRRILYGMNELGLFHNKQYKKSARIVGEVLGKYHPHGDSSVYQALVRMAQPWSLRYPLIDGQGNFGSIDDDSPAAMRYTEARLTRIASYLLSDLDKDTVDFQPNFDETLKEPKVLPTRIPNLLINGASGIAVGMATSMPPHNLSDVIDAIVAYIKNPSISDDELISIVKAPDFPTGGIIYGYEGVKKAYLTGKGKIIIRAKHHIEYTRSGKPMIVFTEIPYQVNKAAEIQKIADLVNNKKIDGIVYANDESDRNGLRVVITLKKDANVNVVLNKIFKYTQFQSSFNVNNIALVNGRPKLLTLRELISEFVKFRHNIILRRTRYELAKAEAEAHIKEGLLIALDHIDEVISLIRSSENTEKAKKGLIERFSLSEKQALAILAMRLQTLTGLERQKIKDEYDQLIRKIAYLKEILENYDKQMQVIIDELVEIKEKFGDKRKTEIQYITEESNPEDFYSNDTVVITISNKGYVKRTLLREYKMQNRGGKGLKGASTRDGDFIESALVAKMHNTLLFFTEKGKVFRLKVYEIPEGSRTSQGRHIQNLLQIDQDDKIRAYIKIKDFNDKNFIDTHYIVLATEHGIIKKTRLSEFMHIRRSGITAISFKDNDHLLTARLTNGKNKIMLASSMGKAVLFDENQIRPMGRTAAGVKAMTLENDSDKVIGMVCLSNENEQILVVTENGYGKRSLLSDYRMTNRGAKGVKTVNITEKTGTLVAILAVNPQDHIMIITKSAQTIRVKVENIRMAGRATQGVKLIKLAHNDAIAAVVKIQYEIMEENNHQHLDNEIDTDIEPILN